MYKAWRIPGIGEKAKWIVVDENGNIVDRSPTREELMNLKEGICAGYKRYKYTKDKLLRFLINFYEENRRVPTCSDFDEDHKYPSFKIYYLRFGSWNNAIKESGLWKKRYNPAHTCDRCGKDFGDQEESRNYPLKEYDKKGNWNGNWDCPSCYQTFDPNSQHNLIKSVADCRTRNQRPDSTNIKGDKGQKLLCAWKGYTDLNKENDNYKSPIDCIDEKTRQHYQAKIAYYNNIERSWKQEFQKLIKSIKTGFRFKILYMFCVSKDGKIIERIYELPEKEIYDSETNKGRGSISIMMYDSNMRPYENGWYARYRNKDLEELENVNKTWQSILREEKRR